MSVEAIQYGLIAGEFSPRLFGRGDLTKYDQGVALGENFFVDYGGGMLSRPGTEFCEWVKNPTYPTRLVPFLFAPNVANTYMMLFGHQYVRFLQDGAYVLEAAKTITAATKANPGVITSAAHGYSNGDWVKITGVVGMTQLNDRTFIVANKTNDTFELTDVFGANVNTSAYTTYVSGGSAYRIYTLTTGYDGEDLATMCFDQRLDTVHITHADYAPADLVRASATSWSLTTTAFGTSATRPSNLQAFPNADNDIGFVVAVTSIDSEGQESLPVFGKFRDQSSTQNTYTIDIVTGAQKYNWYRSVALSGNRGNQGHLCGFIAQTIGVVYSDQAVIPDFTLTPPLHYNPFANGAITSITVTAGGSGYTSADENKPVTVSGGGGSGFIGYPIRDEGNSTIVGVRIVHPGSGYSGALTVAITGQTGTGATFTATANGLTGNYPRQNVIFQQRRWYASTPNAPIDFFASRVGQFKNFDYGDIVTDGDGIEFTLDSGNAAPVLHLIPTRSGLLLLRQPDAILLSGDTERAITPLNALAEPQDYNGCSTLRPIGVLNDFLYVEGDGVTVRLLRYNEYSRLYQGADVTILSQHLIEPNNTIVDWTFVQSPHRVASIVREDGRMLTMTIDTNNETYAWTRHKTRGKYKNIASLPEDDVTRTYMVVERKLGGTWTKVVERQYMRNWPRLEEAQCLDCALELDRTYPAATLNVPTAATGAGIAVTATNGTPFAAGDVGKIIRCGGGKLLITGYTSSTAITCTIQRAITDVVPELDDNTPFPFASGEWTMDTAQTAIGGLWHLEGLSVKAVADGVVSTHTVTNGSITLATAASRVIVGLAYTCTLQTLPPVIDGAGLQGRRLKVHAIATRVLESKGMTVGVELTHMRPMPLEEDDLSSGYRHNLLNMGFDTDAQIYIQQSNPYPAGILSYIRELTSGDKKDARS